MRKKCAPPAFYIYKNDWKNLLTDNLMFDIAWQYVWKLEPFLTTILGFSGSQGPLRCSGWPRMVPDHWYTVPHYGTAPPGCIGGFKIPNQVKMWAEMPLKFSFRGVFWGFWLPGAPQGCSRWSKMVPGCWYTVPHYATALQGCNVGFKIPNPKCFFFWSFIPASFQLQYLGNGLFEWLEIWGVNSPR